LWGIVRDGTGRYLSTILDDYSRYIIAWKLCTTMKAGDVTDTLEMALTASGCDQAHVRHKPRLLSDNGSSYVSGDLAEWLDKQRMDHTRGAPYGHLGSFSPIDGRPLRPSLAGPHSAVLSMLEFRLGLADECRARMPFAKDTSHKRNIVEKWVVTILGG
jgi:transposase InsO family protein